LTGAPAAECARIHNIPLVLAARAFSPVGREALRGCKLNPLRGGFITYRHCFERPLSLERSFVLHPEPCFHTAAYDHEIPFFSFGFDALRTFDLPNLQMHLAEQRQSVPGFRRLTTNGSGGVQSDLVQDESP
jgi:hypothetical protein